MKLMFDAFWRAVGYCLHPRVIGLSFLPLVLMVVLSFALGYFFWERAVADMAAWLQSYELMQAFLGWLERLGMDSLRTVFAPLLILMIATPVIVLLCLLLVAAFMTPAMVELVARRRFPTLERKRGGSLVVSVLWSLASTVAALALLLISMPLWLVLAMGVISGYLGAAPSLLWASGAMFIALAPLLVPVAIWIYTLVFAFASLWFAHFTLTALQRMRAAAGVEVLDAEAGPAPVVSSAEPPSPLLPPGP